VISLSPQYKAIFPGRFSTEAAKAVAKFTGEILLAGFAVWQAGNVPGCGLLTALGCIHGHSSRSAELRFGKFRRDLPVRADSEIGAPFSATQHGNECQPCAFANLVTGRWSRLYSPGD
jgi:hypothetical protein